MELGFPGGALHSCSESSAWEPGKGQMGNVRWSIKGPEFVNCNCAWGCPCQFNALPTHGDCRAICAMRIDEGHFGDVGLEGLHFVNRFSWPGAIHEGNGTHQSIIDVRADDRQRHALGEILHGRQTEPGATVFQVFSTTMSNVLDPLFEPIELEIDIERRTARVRVPGLVEAKGEPIRNLITGEEHRVRVALPNGFEYLEAEFGSGSTRSTGDVELDFRDSYGQFAYLHLTQNGPVR